jgi:hypothetical protein
MRLNMGSSQKGLSSSSPPCALAPSSDCLLVLSAVASFMRTRLVSQAPVWATPRRSSLWPSQLSGSCKKQDGGAGGGGGGGGQAIGGVGSEREKVVSQSPGCDGPVWPHHAAAACGRPNCQGPAGKGGGHWGDEGACISRVGA